MQEVHRVDRHGVAVDGVVVVQGSPPRRIVALVRIVVDGVEVRLDPVRWEVVYPAHVEPIGEIVLERAGYRATLDQEYLGLYPDGDAAVEAVWARFIDASAARHAHASVTHGAAERHVRS